MSNPQDWMDRLPGFDGRHRATQEGHPHTSESAGSTTKLTDLRRRRREESAEQIVHAAQYLPPAERVLIESIFRDGRRVSDMAKLIASPGRHASPTPPTSNRARSLLGAPGHTLADSFESSQPPLAQLDPAYARDQSEQDARALRSRVRRVVRRIMTPEYQAVARWFAIEKLSDGLFAQPSSLSHPAAPDGPGGTLRRRIAISCFLHGLSIREAARQLGLSLHTVRRHRDAVAAMAAMTPHLRTGIVSAVSKRPAWRETEPRS